MNTRIGQLLPRRPTAAAAVVSVMATVACATTHMSIRYSDLATQTEMSESVFLDLRSRLAPTVFVERPEE